MFVAFEEGVYRHQTIAASDTLEGLIPAAIEYFKGQEDFYHTIEIEDISTEKVECVESWMSRGETKQVAREVCWGWNKYDRKHGEQRIEDMVGYTVATWNTEYTLEEDEVWADTLPPTDAEVFTEQLARLRKAL